MSAREAPPRVLLSIEALELEGFALEQRFALAEAFEKELTRLITERGVPRGWLQPEPVPSAATPGAREQSVALDPSGPAWLCGRQIALAVYRSGA